MLVEASALFTAITGKKVNIGKVMKKSNDHIKNVSFDVQQLYKIQKVYEKHVSLNIINK